MKTQHSTKIKYAYYLYILILAIPFEMRPQKASTRVPTTPEYAKWTTLETQMMDDSGNWILFNSAGELGDTIIVQSQSGTKKHSFPNAKSGTFIKDAYLIIQDNQGLTSIDLKKDAIKTVSGVKNYGVAGNALVVSKSTGKNRVLEVRDLKMKLLYTLKDVREYSLQQHTTFIAVVTEDDSKSMLKILYFENEAITESIIKIDANKISNLTWSDDGRQLAYLEQTSQGLKLNHYDTTKKLGKMLQTVERPLEDFNILAHLPLAFSEDGKSLFFKVRYHSASPQNDKNTVQVWNAYDKWIYPIEQMVMGFTRSLHVMRWDLENDKYNAITDSLFPEAKVGPGSHWAVVYNPKTYEPQFKENAPLDVYCKNLKTGILHKVLTKQPGTETDFFAAPDERNIVYFRKGIWYAYDVENKSHTVLTNTIDVSAYEKNNFVSRPQSMGCAGWTTDGKSVLLFDEFDIWKVALNGSQALRLTKGSETNTVYRLAPPEVQTHKSEYSMQVLPSYNTTEDLLVSGRSVDYLTNGLYLWNTSLKRTTIYEDQKRIYGLIRKKQALAWTCENYTVPAQVFYASIKVKAKKIASSNSHEQRFAPRKLEVITYPSYTGEALRGLLYYPANYSTEKHYPMITSIYEIQSNDLHQHWIPSLSSSEVGFNVQHYLSKGYFVLLPDLTYAPDLAGHSATIGVENAVHAALKIANIDPNKIGLIGHSFGGYQTTFIITQRPLFACAVAGAPTTDFVSAALSVYRNRKTSNMWRVENSQSRIRESVTKDKAAYIANAPIYFVKEIQTPLLSWTGLEDSQVEPTQSMELYMAMRREGKEHILLNYPNEGHGLYDPRNSADLTAKVEDWFEHYLKEKPKKEWMLPTN